MQHTASHGNTLQHTATHQLDIGCLWDVSDRDILTAAPAPHRTTPQHTATHCNTQLAVGCLWDVSDRDIDRFADALFRFGGLYLNQVSLT